MLPSVGYFRGINCPFFAKEGRCKKPYCHFRHKLDANASVGKDIIGDSCKQLLDCQVSVTSIQNEPSYGIKQAVKGSQLNEVFKCTAIKRITLHPLTSSVSYFKSEYLEPQKRFQIPAKVGSSCTSTVLHGAKGAAAAHSQPSTFKSSVTYNVSSADKPSDDLQYDPMSNFNLKKHASKAKKDTNEQLQNKECIIVDLTEDSSSEITINGDESKDLSNETDSSSSSVIVLENDEKESRSLVSRQIKSALASADPVVISDSDEETVVEKPQAFVSLTPICPEIDQSDNLKLETDLFGTDSDTDSGTATTANISDNTISSKISNNLKVVLNKTKHVSDKVNVTKKSFTKQSVAKTPSKDVPTTQSKDVAKTPSKDVAKTPSKENVLKALPKDKHKLVKSAKDKTKKLLKKRKNDSNSFLKRKKSKVDNEIKFGDPSDIAKYVSKDEIEKLDKELLTDVGMFDECYRIYQENEKQSDPTSVERPKEDEDNFSSIKPAKIFKDAVEDAKHIEVQNTILPGKNKRIARTAASLSARNLNRDQRQMKRFLTPAQKMMQRAETIRREQEEKLLSSLSKQSPSATKSSTSSANLKTPQSNSRVSHQPSSLSRVAHQQSSSLLQSKLKFPSKKPLSASSLSSNISKQRRPFDDLRRKSTSSTFVQSTVPKGFSRKAHAPSSNVEDILEKPTILPDRHSKVPTNIRQRYLNVFIEECSRIFGNNPFKAYETAKNEEQQCNSRSKSKTIYLSLAASTLKRLRSQIAEDFNGQNKSPTRSSTMPVKSVKTSPTVVAFKSNNMRVAHNTSPTKAAAVLATKMKTKSKTKISDVKKNLHKRSFSILKEEKQNTLSDYSLYENLRRYLLTDEDLGANGFPRPGNLPGSCIFSNDKPKPNPSKEKKTCARCGKEYRMSKSGYFFAEDDECIHHWGKAFPTKVGSHYEKRYTCCQTPSGSAGCSVAETHVHKDNVNTCDGYVQTLKKSDDGRNPGVYALDCEMAFTVEGLELIRISVVNFDGKLVYDTLVKPKGKVLDYNTRWSGLTADDLKGATATLQDVHVALLTRFSADTILIGHSLESDLVALRLIHSCVIDTSVAFPHRLGLPYKRALRTLMAENLGIIIQNSVDEGHDSMEDALACIKLMQWKLEEDSKLFNKSMQR